MIGNVTAVVLAFANFILRLGAGVVEGALAWGLSTIVVLLLVYTGWKGGTSSTSKTWRG
ncbi:DUF2231 domain-containing protein [Mesorhizobium muleiense]|uniref:DUF2231 domain-containing protein n=1 Tax=Mesorhizobium muleiense TaxID=1004279 RepID=UPI001F170414|nr:DUF2231 domain-containing protein [Mesorhizobium muleiense]